jgi:ABC-2 type transport system permease protein
MPCKEGIKIKMKELASIFTIFMTTRIKRNMQYRGKFLLDSVFFVFGYGTQALLMFFLVSRFETINGWKPMEVTMLFAYVLTSYTLANSFFNGIRWDLAENIRTGNFDQSMIKPLHPLLYEIAGSFSPYYFLHFFMSVGMILYCAFQLSVHLTISTVIVLCMTILGGAFIQGAVQLFFSTLSFFLINNPFRENFYSNIRPMIEYPISIFPRAVQLLLSTLLPMAFVSFYPAQHLLGKNDFLFFPPLVQYISLPVGVISLFLVSMFWNFSMKHYKSSGS